jgi:hypothetical protein
MMGRCTQMEMLPLIALFFLSGSPAPRSCSLIRPVAPDEPSARRIAEAVLQNTHASRFPPNSKRPYVLKVVPAPHDPNGWAAFQDLGDINMRGSGGLGFRIDRCTGAISELFYQR